MIIALECVHARTRRNPTADTCSVKAAVSGAIESGASVRTIARLLLSPAFQSVVLAIEERLKQPVRTSVFGPITDDPEYKLVVRANAFVNEIDNEVAVAHKFTRDLYAKRFPELESLVLAPLDYVKAVGMIGNDTNVTRVKLDSFLPASIVMAVNVTASTTRGKPLSDSELARVNEACKMVVRLDEVRSKINTFVESRMQLLAPNLSVVVGPSVAAKLLGIAGGLEQLAKIPSCNILVLGASKKSLAGFASVHAQLHMGLVYQSDIVVGVPQEYRRNAARFVAAKAALAARVDSFHEAADGRIGRELRAEIVAKLDKLQEPPPPRPPKPLAVPNEIVKNRRGGRRVRRLKEKHAMSDLRKAANRIKFGTDATDDYDQTDLGYHPGMMMADSGRVRLLLNEKSKVSVSKRLQRDIEKRRVGGIVTPAGALGAVSMIPGASSSALGSGAGSAAAATPAGGSTASQSRASGMSSVAFTPIVVRAVSLMKHSSAHWASFRAWRSRTPMQWPRNASSVLQQIPSISAPTLASSKCVVVSECCNVASAQHKKSQWRLSVCTPKIWFTTFTMYNDECTLKNRMLTQRRDEHTNTRL
jgi:U4/U6 small nuclear ribonucleoprotein PRP31